MSQNNPNQHEIDTYAAEYILNGGDQTKAWRKTFPTSKAKDDIAWQKASKMHAFGKVQERIAELQEKQRQKSEALFDMSAEQLKKTLAAVMKEGLKPAEGKPQLSAVVSAVAELNRMNGNHAPTKISPTDTDGNHAPMIIERRIIDPVSNDNDTTD